MLSGMVLILLLEMFKILRDVNKPMESGNDSKRLDETSSSSSFTNPAIESGSTCLTTKIVKTFQILDESRKKSRVKVHQKVNLDILTNRLKV